MENPEKKSELETSYVEPRSDIEAARLFANLPQEGRVVKKKDHIQVAKEILESSQEQKRKLIGTYQMPFKKEIDGVSASVVYLPKSKEFIYVLKGTPKTKNFEKKLKKEAKDIVISQLPLVAATYRDIGFSELESIAPKTRLVWEVEGVSEEGFREELQTLLSKSPKELLGNTWKDTVKKIAVTSGLALTIPIVAGAWIASGIKDAFSPVFGYELPLKDLIGDYSGLAKKYNELVDEFNSAVGDYGELVGKYNELITSTMSTLSQDILKLDGVVSTFDSIENYLSGASDSIDSVLTHLNDLGVEVGNLDTYISSAKTYASNIESLISDARSELSTISTTAQNLLENNGTLDQMQAYLDSAREGLGTSISNLQSIKTQIDSIYNEAIGAKTSVDARIDELKGPTGGTTYVWGDGTEMQVSADYDEDGVPDVRPDGNGGWIYDEDSGNPAIWYHKNRNLSNDTKNVATMFETNAKNYSQYQQTSASLGTIALNATAASISLDAEINRLDGVYQNIITVGGNSSDQQGMVEDVRSQVQTIADSAQSADSSLDNAQTNLSSLSEELDNAQTSISNMETYIQDSKDKLNSAKSDLDSAYSETISTKEGVVEVRGDLQSKYDELAEISQEANPYSAKDMVLVGEKTDAVGRFQKVSKIIDTIKWLSPIAALSAIYAEYSNMKKGTGRNQAYKQILGDFCTYQGNFTKFVW